MGVKQSRKNKPQMPDFANLLPFMAAALALNLTPGWGLFEYACHEGNYAMRNMLSAARAAETGKGAR